MKSLAFLLQTLLLLFVLEIVLASSWAHTSQGMESSSPYSVLQIDHPMEFQMEDNQIVHLPPDTYAVFSDEADRLHIRSLSINTSYNIPANLISHQESLRIPLALVIVESDKSRHITLLLPDGRGLDAIGTTIMVQSRGVGPGASFQFSREKRYTGVILQQGRVATDNDWNEKDSVSSAGPSDQPPESTPSYGKVTLDKGRFQLDRDARRVLFRRCKTCWKSQQ